MCNFKSRYGFIVLALCALTIFSYPVYAKIKIEPTYHKADRNQDGVITLKEWRNESDLSFNKRDWNHDGILSGNEIKDSTLKPTQSSDPFRALDQNQDGMIVLSEWNGSLTTFQARDTNENGQISAQEFHVTFAPYARSSLRKFARFFG